MKKSTRMSKLPTVVRFLSILIWIFTWLTLLCAQGATEVAATYFEELKKKDFEAAAAAFHPDALSEFRQMMSFIGEIPLEAQEQFLGAFFGPGSTPESVSQLSHPEFFASCLRAIMARADAAGVLQVSGDGGVLSQGSGTQY